MASVEERLRDVLHQVAPDSPGVAFDGVARRVRRRRSVTAVASAMATVLVAAGFAVAVTDRGGSGRERVVTNSGKAPTASPRAIHFQGIGYSLPAGWTRARPDCGSPAEHTVVVGFFAARCPYSPQRPTTAVRLTPIYGPQFALRWSGARTTWHGQPAWLSQETVHGLTTATLALPWLNAWVDAQSRDAATARALLDNVSVHVEPHLDVPPDATSVFIQSLAGHDGDGQKRDVTVRNAPDVDRLLADLRSLAAVTTTGRACDGSWSPRTALLTLQGPYGSRTYAARFDRCGLVVAGTGSAATVSNSLLFDIRRLVPSSGL